MFAFVVLTLLLGGFLNILTLPDDQVDQSPTQSEQQK